VFTFCVFMIFALFDYKGGVANFIGMALFQPIAALIAAGLTIIFCLIIGLPIRMNKQLNIWWRKNFYVSLILTFIGISFCAVSLVPQFMEEITYSMEGMDFEDSVPNRLLSLVGWFFLSFGTLHLFPPYELQQKLENIISSVLQVK